MRQAFCRIAWMRSLLETNPRMTSPPSEQLSRRSRAKCNGLSDVPHDAWRFRSLLQSRATAENARVLSWSAGRPMVDVRSGNSHKSAACGKTELHGNTRRRGGGGQNSLDVTGSRHLKRTGDTVGTRSSGWV